MEIMASDGSAQMENLLIARLNDVAYKTINKRGTKKRMDERAIKNEKLFKSMEMQIDQIHKQIDFKKLEAEQFFVDQIGSCTLSCCNTLELME